jgi:hypothetical protein
MPGDAETRTKAGFAGNVSSTERSNASAQQQGGLTIRAPATGNSPFPDPNERTPSTLVVEDEVLIRFAICDCL